MLSSGLFPKPTPGSRHIREGATPYASRSRARSRRYPSRSCITWADWGRRGLLFSPSQERSPAEASPMRTERSSLPAVAMTAEPLVAAPETGPECMTTQPQSDVAATSTIRGSEKPVTSLTTWAPRSTQLRATSGWRVSIETSAPSWTSQRTTGSKRRSSSLGTTGVNPGRVDSPPTSTRSAPSASICAAVAIASLGALCVPPSEKESGVTLSTPITRGRDRSRAMFEQFQMDAFGIAVSLGVWPDRPEPSCSAQPRRPGAVGPANLIIQDDWPRVFRKAAVRSWPILGRAF